jgi:hypothetical protein
MFARVIALFMFVWPYVCPHILCTQLVICLLSHFIHIWYLGWPWFEHVQIMPISPMVDFCESYSPFHVCLTIRPFAHFVYAPSHLSFVVFYSYTNMKSAITLTKINHPWNRHNMRMHRSWPTGILVGHDLCMRILCRFRRWLIFARVIALFMFVWPYVHSHILCTQLVICLMYD